MKKGVSTWCFPAEMSYAERFAVAKDAGYETLEVAVDEEGELSLESSKKDVLTIRRAAEKVGIGLPSVASGLAWVYSPSSPDASIRRNSLRIWKKSLQIAGWLGADTLLVVPGMVSSLGETEGVPYELALQRSREAVEAAIPTAQKAGVALGLENVWNRMLYMPLEFRDFVDSFHSEVVGAYFDVGNCLPCGFPEDYINVLGSRIRKVHIKDFKLSIGNLDGFVPLLSGDVNFPAVVKALKKCAYDGPLTVEVGPTRHHSEMTVYSSSLALDLILGRRKSIL